MRFPRGPLWNYPLHPSIGDSNLGQSSTKRAAADMDRTELERKSSSMISSAKSAHKPKVSRSRNPLKELNSGYPRPSKSREGVSRGSIFSNSVSSKVDFIPKLKPIPKTPISAPANPRLIRSLKNIPQTRTQRSATSKVRSGFALNLKKDGNFGFSRDFLCASKDDQIEVQSSKTPNSGKTGTPPFGASISPEFSSQSVMPTPACFATGHLLTGIQDKRKCKPRGILNVGNSGFDAADSKNLGSVFSSRKSRSSITSPIPLGASVQWHPSPSETSVSWVFSPKESLKGKCAIQDLTPNSFGTTPSSDHYLLHGSPCTSSMLQKTPSAMESCRSPATSSSLSPFSMILQRASAMPQDGGRCHYISPAHDLPFSPNTKSNSNVMCTPSSSISSKKVDEFSIVDSSPVPFLCESFHFGCSLSPLSSADLSRFQRSPFLPNSPSKKMDLVGDGSSEKRISWREGLISRIFSMHEFSDCFLSPEREGQKLEKVKGLNEKLGFGSFEFSGQAPCEDSPVVEEQCLTSSGDSDWTFFFQNQLFED